MRFWHRKHIFLEPSTAILGYYITTDNESAHRPKAPVYYLGPLKLWNIADGLQKLIHFSWKFYLFLLKENKESKPSQAPGEISLDLLSTCLLKMGFGFDATLCSNLGNEYSDEGHIKCPREQYLSRWLQVPTLALKPNPTSQGRSTFLDSLPLQDQRTLGTVMGKQNFVTWTQILALFYIMSLFSTAVNNLSSHF